MHQDSLSEVVLSTYLAQARELMGETRELITRALQREFRFSLKPDESFVTEIDMDVERTLRSRLKQLFPSHGIVGEEFSQENTSAAFTWSIDPIDGTTSLRHRVPLFGTILALRYDATSVLGLIDLPGLDRLYSGGMGIGAFCNDRPLRTMDVENDADIFSEIISVGGRSGFVKAGMPHIFDNIMKLRAHVRTYSDCFGHAMAIEGAVGAMVDFDLNIWDIAATEILVQEAGGKYVCFKRADGETDRYDAIFGKPRVVDWLLRTLAIT